MRSKLATGVVLLALCSCLIAAPFALAADKAAGDPTAQQIKKLKKKATKKVTKAVKKDLAGDSQAGLAPADDKPEIKIRSCKQRQQAGDFAGFTCTWIADGELPGVVPFKCDGKAKVDAKAKVKKLDECKNEAEEQSPLLATPHSVRYGFSESFDVATDLWDEVDASGADTALMQLNWEALQPSPGGAAVDVELGRL